MPTDLIMGETGKSLAGFQDPFKHDKVAKIEIEAFPNTNSMNVDPQGVKHRVKATIRFVAGSTIGYHYIYADTIVEVASRVQDFLKTLG